MRRISRLAAVAFTLLCLPAAAQLPADSDGDGLSDADEVNVYRSDPFNQNSDSDGLPDGIEVSPYRTNPIDFDTDDDGLSDGDEVGLHGTDPLRVDSDDDDFSDAAELSFGTSPLATGSRPAFAATAVAAGDYHTCALSSAGGVLCWGFNRYGQLGNGSTAQSSIAVPVSGLASGVAAIAAGEEHTCALTSGGGVWCWGFNGYGALGNGSTAESSVPVPVSGLASGIVAISAGGQHTCAITTGGGALCWGFNGYGQLGNGGSANSDVPTPVSGLASGVAAIAVGDNHTCALSIGSGASCWGNNVYGQLGNGSIGYRTVPTPVSGLGSGVAAIGAGWGHSCALTTGGAALCWGNNENGQLGDATTAQSDVPVAVSGLGSGVAAIAVGGTHTCALTAGGSARCWGDDSHGQLGDGGTMQSTIPVQVSGLASGGIAIAAAYHTCVITTGGSVRCWGYNNYGQLGDGRTTAQSSVPAAVSDLASGVVAIAAHYGHNCALSSGGGVSCWGSGYSGELGDGNATPRSVPVSVSGLSSGVAAISAGSYHTCALTNGGGVLCWGDNEYGQLGDGSTTQSSVPVPVSGLASGVAAISAGVLHTCALTTGGGVRCWGRNFNGQLGDGSTTQSSVPVPVSGLASGVAAITTGAQTCALTTGGGVLCWGYNGTGTLGNGTTTHSSVPVPVLGLASGVTAVSAGVLHACALTSAGGVRCWGYNGNGQLGNGNTVWSSIPVSVSGLAAGVASITAADYHTCAVMIGDTLRCWGWNFIGQLGSGNTPESSLALPVWGLASGVVAIAGGEQHTCALSTGGVVQCWGGNVFGQLGDGSAISSRVPIDVAGFEAGGGGGPPAVPALGVPGLLLLAAALVGAGATATRRRARSNA